MLAVGSQVLWPDDALHRQLVKALPSAVSERIQLAKAENITAQPFDAVIFHGDSDQLRALCESVAAGWRNCFGVFCPWRKQYPSGTAVYRAFAECEYRCRWR